MLPITGRFLVLPIAAVLIITALARVSTTAVEPAAAARTVVKAELAQQQTARTGIRLAAIPVSQH